MWCSSCIVYIVLMIVLFTIFTAINVHLVYYNWSLIANNVSYIKFNTHKETEIWWWNIYNMRTIKQINIKNWTYCFYNYIIDLQNVDARLLKIDKKPYKDIGIYNIG